MPKGPVPDRYHDILQSTVLGHLATVDPRGRPNVNPVWFIADGEHIFLEVNPQGQFLFLETRAGLPLLDMFSEFLLAGVRDFTWRDDHEVLRFEEYQEHRKRTWRDEAARHVGLRKPLGVPDVVER